MRNAFVRVMFVLGLMMIAGTLSGFGQKADVAGEWDGSFNTPGGARPLKFVFVVDGEKLTGTAKRSSGDVPLTGTIKGSEIKFSYTVDYNGNALTLTFYGKVSGDSVSGTVSFGGNAEDTWSAKRSAEKPKSE